MIIQKFSEDNVTHIAKLANIPVSPDEAINMAEGFNTTISVVDNLFKINVKGIQPAYQVTGLENVMREDEINLDRQLSQDQALMNAKRTHNGFFVVDQVIEQDG